MGSIGPEEFMVYYKRLMPFKSLFAWLNHQHAPTRLFTNREWALTIGDAYVRWNSYANADEFKKEIVRMNPSRFEIGAVYSAKPKDKKTVSAAAFQPVLRELVFDIDMTDYDEIRTCCSDKKICKRCWGFMAAACDVLDRALREDLGYKHLLWVFSGRRGIHCWISDASALALTDSARRSLLSYLELIKGGLDVPKRVHTRFGSSARTSTAPIHPMLGGALESLTESFASVVLDDQECFRDRKGWEKLLGLLPASEEELIGKLRRKWEEEEEDGSPSSSADKWDDLKAEIKAQEAKEGQRNKSLRIALEEIILQYTYPRLDAEVTKKRNHLLKAPFCIHPSTGNVCVPIDPARVHEFDPNGVPTIQGLIEELNSAKVDEGSGERHADWELTSLKPYVQMLDKHAQGLMREVRQVNKTAAMKGLEF